MTGPLGDPGQKGEPGLPGPPGIKGDRGEQASSRTLLNKMLDVLYVIALSHIHVSAAYRSRIYENVDTPRSEPYFARETYVPRTCDVPATFLWRIRDVSVFVWNFTFVCTAYQCVCATYV